MTRIGGFLVSEDTRCITDCDVTCSMLLLCRQLLLLRGYAFNHSADFETVRQMKEKLCYVGYDIEQEQKLALETTVLVEQYTVRVTDVYCTLLFSYSELRATAFCIRILSINLDVVSPRSANFSSQLTNPLSHAAKAVVLCDPLLLRPTVQVEYA